MESKSEKSGKNMSDVQEINRSLVLKIIQQNDQCSRIEIARELGLRQTTITNIVNDLLESEVVVETSLIRGARGRRAIGLSLNNEKYRIVGVRLTRHHVLTGLFDLSGVQYAESRLKISAEEGVSAALKTVCKAISDMIRQAKETSVLGIGVGIPGPYLRKSGSIAVMADFPGWDSVPLRNELAQAFPFPVFVEYDAHVSALAEWFAGRHYGSDSVLMSVLVEQGLGAGVVCDGTIFYGAQGIAGNIGHMSIDYRGIPCECGNVGCLRNYCTSKAVLHDVADALKTSDTTSVLKNAEQLTLDDVIRAANSGDELARNAIRRAARYLGYGLTNAVYVYNPDVIVIGGEFSAAGELYLSEVRSVLNERLRSSIASGVSVCFSEIKGDQVLRGTAMLVTNSTLQSPSMYFKI